MIDERLEHCRRKRLHTTQLAFGDVQSRYLFSYSSCEPYQNFGVSGPSFPYSFSTGEVVLAKPKASFSRAIGPSRRSRYRITGLRVTEHHVARVPFIKYNIFLRSGSKFRLRNRLASSYIAAKKTSIPASCEEIMIHGQVLRDTSISRAFYYIFFLPKLSGSKQC